MELAIFSMLQGLGSVRKRKVNGWATIFYSIIYWRGTTKQNQRGVRPIPTLAYHWQRLESDPHFKPHIMAFNSTNYWFKTIVSLFSYLIRIRSKCLVNQIYVFNGWFKIEQVSLLFHNSFKLTIKFSPHFTPSFIAP